MYTRNHAIDQEKKQVKRYRPRHPTRKKTCFKKKSKKNAIDQEKKKFSDHTNRKEQKQVLGFYFFHL